MSDLLEDTKIEVKSTDAGDHDTFAHYFEKTDLAKAWLDGQPIEALCGKWDIPTKDFTKYPVCPTCEEVRGKMKP